MAINRFVEWARRNGVKPQVDDEEDEAVTRPVPRQAPPVQVPPGYVLVPIGQQPGFEVPRQPQGAVPYIPSPPPTSPYPGGPTGRVIPFRGDTNQLVRPGNRDTYAELLNQLPDLVPQMAGDGMSPSTAAEMGPLISEFGGLSGEEPMAYPSAGRGSVGSGGVQKLGSVALPPPMPGFEDPKKAG